MTRPAILILAAAFLVGLYTGHAQAATYVAGHRVMALLVGGIDATPCSDTSGCVRGVVELRYQHNHTDHLIRCPHPRHLHVMGTFREAGHRHVAVWACRRAYDWRLPR